ncbi:hypothetical protein [Nonomuraea sp. 10N515B]|uniref:hypothetical protein n=1 Tax=Nonomuraea sp. 10N515B TaxID=3457422 RepID=UPI003FCDF64C
MKNTISVAGHEAKVDQGEYEDFDDDGQPVIRATGRSTWWCSCGERGAGPNHEVAVAIREHLGVDEDEEMRDRGE